MSEPAAPSPVPSTLAGPVPGRRRRFTKEEKRQLLAQAMAAGETMSSVGRRHGLSVSLLFRWRRQLEGRQAQRSVEPSHRTELRELRDRVNELERLLGKKTLECERLAEELAQARGETVDVGAVLLAPAREGTV